MHVAILGNGIAGVTAALRIRQRQPDWRITMISGESQHHYSRPALMYIAMGHMRYEDTKPYEDRYWEKRRIDLVHGWVTKIDTEGRRLHVDGGIAPLEYDALLLATGSIPAKFGWPGQDLGGVQGFYGLQDLTLLYQNLEGARQAIIVGGGLIGIELAEVLKSRNLEVTFLVREQTFWSRVMPPEESRMLNDLIRHEGVGLVVESNLREIVDDGHGRVCGVDTEEGERFNCQFVGLTTGVRPNVDVAKRSDIPVGRGVLVDWQLRSSVPGVYAAGDCAEIITEGDARNLLQQVWYTGKLQGEVAGDVISGDERTYDPGIWFNSAKFLTLEYQVYGDVNMQVEGEHNLFWKHADNRRSIRIVYTDDGVIGFNLLGIRYRQEVCEGWIRDRVDIDTVLAHLGEANFDPEFYARHEDAARQAFAEQLRAQRRNAAQAPTTS